MGKSPRVRKKGNHYIPFVRTRSIVFDHIGNDYFTTSSPMFVDGSHIDGATIGINSLMADNLADHFEFGERPVMEVDHLKVVKSFGPRTVTTPFYWFPFEGFTDWTFATDGAFWQGPGIADLTHIAPLPPSSVLSDHAIKAFHEILEQFPAEISLPNTLAELKEIPSLINTVRDVKDLLKALKRKETGESIRKAADVHAGYNFGVSPLIGDISTVFNLRTIVHKRLQHLKRNKGKWARAGSLTRYSSSAEHSPYFYMEGFALDEKISLRLIHSEYKIHSQARIKNDLSWVDDWEGWVRAFLSTTGFNNPAAVIWEATPFSWAVDYLLPVGDYLSTMSFQQIEGWNIKRLCTSITGVHTIAVGIHPRNGVWRDLGTFKLQRFSRIVGLPPFSWHIDVPSTKQTSLLAAVAIGRNG